MRLTSGHLAAVALGALALTNLSCGGSSSVTGSPTARVTPTPEPTEEPTPTPAPCGEPLPPPISEMRVRIHLRAGDYWTLDATALVASSDYCRSIGYTDGRSVCPVRAEGHPERVACEEYAVGHAADNGRAGPTWTRNGNFCTGIDSGCDNDEFNQFQLRVYWQGEGDYSACAENGVCGTIFARGPAISD